ncbi:MAG: hypothetical protein Q7R93_04040 [bacterium]|nr:hypothetical protein [bacterium]
MKRAIKTVGAFLFTAFVSVSVFGVFTPQRAEAVVSLVACFSAKAAEGGIALGKTATALATSVSTISPAEAEIAAEAGAGTSWVQCFLRGLAITIAKTLLHTFTQSIVNWINRGFEGEPSFVTDLGGFLTDTADQAFGEAIGQIAPMLCSPFRIDIKAALGLQASLSGKDEVRCRLSDVFANVQGSYQQFVTGSFASGGGWNSWINISGSQQNNPYGAYLATQNYVGLRITSATGKTIKELDFGQGFKSWKPCKVKGDPIEVKNKDGSTRMRDDDESAPLMRKGPCKEYGEIKTPGSVIVDQANESLKGTLKELQVAQDIDAIVGALVNQLLIKAMTGIGGLAGVSKSDATSGGKASADSMGTDPEKVLASSNVRPPAGIDCTKRYYPAIETTLTGIRPNDSINIVYTDKLDSTGRVVVVQGQILTVPAMANGKEIHKESWAPAIGGQTWADYFKQVELGCANTVANLLDSETNKASSLTGGSSTKVPVVVTPPANQPEKANLAQLKKVLQSSTYAANQASYPPESANDTSTQSFSHTCDYKECSERGIQHDEPEPWWEVDLSTSRSSDQKYTINEIKTIEIVQRADAPYQSMGLYAFFSNTPLWSAIPNATLDKLIYASSATDATCNHTSLTQQVRCYQIPDSPSQAGAPAGTVSIPVVAGEKGPYLRIQRRDRPMALAEVRVAGTQTRIDANGAPQPAAEQPFAVIFRPNSSIIPNARAGDTITKTVNVNSTKAGPAVSFRIRMYEKGSVKDIDPFLPDPIPFSKYLTSFTLTTTQNGTSVVSPDFIVTDCPSSERCMNPELALKTLPDGSVLFSENRTLSPDLIMPISLNGVLAGRGGTGLAPNTFKFVIEAVGFDGRTPLNSDATITTKVNAP